MSNHRGMDRGGHRGGSRGRGTNFKGSSKGPSIHDRLGSKSNIYNPKNADKMNNRKYKFERSNVSTPSVASMPSEARIRLLSKKFLKSYYEIFDQPGRLNLESQYSADAFFSFSATFPLPTQGRNLLVVPDSADRIKLLVHDKTNIAQQLATFSPTEHLVDFLTVDVPYYIANPMSVIAMHIVVTGVFKDTSETENPLRAFTRLFILKQNSVDKHGEPIYTIFNDLFMLQLPTPDQIKRYHLDAKLAGKSSALSQANTSSNSDQEERRHRIMIQTIMTKTKMNEHGSGQLLHECGWNEDAALDTFNRLFAANGIPQNFFTP